MKRLILTAFCVMTVPDHELWGQQGSSEQEGFTLKVVLYGLVALVPHSEGKEMTALLLQTESKGNDGYHEGILATLNGHCKGDCGSQRKRQDSSLLNWRLDEDFKGMKVRISLKVGSDIESTTNLGGESPFRKLCMEQLPRGRPEDVLSEELDWVPCMREAAPEFDRVKLSCLSDNHDPASCPAKARITFDSSLIQRASVCHFAHADDEYGRFTYRKRKAQMFRRGDRRAIGDAVLLEIRVPGPVALKAARLGTSDPTCPDAQKDRMAILSADSELVLMVSNNYNDPNSKKFDTPIHEHFEHYYSISSRATVGREDDIFMPSAARLWPIFLDSNRGECEEYLKSFEEVVYGITELEDGLHNQRECDLAAFSGH